MEIGGLVVDSNQCIIIVVIVIIIPIDYYHDHHHTNQHEYHDYTNHNQSQDHFTDGCIAFHTNHIQPHSNDSNDECSNSTSSII